MTTTRKARRKASSTPLPGRPVSGSKSGRPIMAALNLLSRRWVLRILWELRAESCGFREMQEHCERMSPDTLSTRLAELKEAGIVEHTASGAWTLTRLGRKLGPTMKALDRWSHEWAGAIRRGEVET